MFLDEDRFYLAGTNVLIGEQCFKKAVAFQRTWAERVFSFDPMKNYGCNTFYGAGDMPYGMIRTYLVHGHIKVQRLIPSWFYERFFWQGVSDAILDSQIVGRRGKQKPWLPRMRQDLAQDNSRFSSVPHSPSLRDRGCRFTVSDPSAAGKNVESSNHSPFVENPSR